MAGSAALERGRSMLGAGTPDGGNHRRRHVAIFLPNMGPR